MKRSPTMILGLVGNAGSGKDTAADFLVKNDAFVKVALADPLKRICRDVFGFTDQQLWGPSQFRNAADMRYVRMKKGALGTTITEWNVEKNEYDTVPSPTEDRYLTPRYALQQLGTEWGRDCYDNIWIDYALRVAKDILMEQRSYDARHGLGTSADGYQVTRKQGVVISDVRFNNEIQAIKKAGGKIVRLLRGTGLEGSAGQHRSETELQEMSHDLFDEVVDNREWTLEQLESHMHGWVQLRLK